MKDPFEGIELDDLIEFLEVGDPKNVPPRLAEYMRMLEQIWGMHRRMFQYPNNESIVRHLMICHELPRPRCVQLVKDALTYFHRENQLSVETWRGILADKGLKAFTAAIRVAKTARDFKDSFSILLELGKFLKWDVEKLDSMEEEILKQVQVLTTDVEMFGLPKVNRQELGNLIDALPDVSEKMKEAAKAEVDGVPFRFLYSEENPRK